MSVKLFLKITSAITAGLGTVLMVFPALIENNFVANPSHGGDIFIRFLGSTLFGYASLNWFTAVYDDRLETRSTLAANLVTLTIAFAISLIAELNGTLNALGWLIVLLHFSFGVGFAYYSLNLYRHLT